MFVSSLDLLLLCSTARVTLMLTCDLQESEDDSTVETERLLGNGTIPPVTEPRNATDILKELFQNYDKRLRPGHAGKALTITVSLGFLSIGNIQEENMEFNADIYMRQIWNDSRLAFGNRDHALILQHEALDKLWLPDTYFENAVKTFVQQETRTVVLYGDGLIVFSQRVTITATTMMTFHAYPMDKQVFRLDIMSYGRDIQQLRYRGTNVQLLNKEMSEFVVTNQSTEITVKQLFMGCFDMLTVNFTAKRRVGYFVIRIYFPCTLCTVVSWMAFWMDCRSIGDRGTVGITSLLTQLFLVGSINEAMPHVSYVKAADLFLIVSFGFTFFALLESVIVYNAAASGRKKGRKISPQKEKEHKTVESYEMDQEENAGSNGVKAKGTQEEISMLHRLARVKVIMGLLENKKGMDTWIDRIARVVFPLGYTIFIISYFVSYSI
ncbi:gamma-aminobutyric acid receptor subunit beta-2-like isoform X1 [Oculina patagonica]